jgi:hypothetical protein
MLYHCICWSAGLLTGLLVICAGALYSTAFAMFKVVAPDTPTPYVAKSYCWSSSAYRVAVYDAPICTMIGLETGTSMSIMHRSHLKAVPISCVLVHHGPYIRRPKTADERDPSAHTNLVMLR